MNPVVLGLNCTKRGLVCADCCCDLPSELLRSFSASQANFMQTATSRRLIKPRAHGHSQRRPCGHGPHESDLIEPSETRVTLVLLRVLYSSTPFIGRVLPMNPLRTGASRAVLSDFIRSRSHTQDSLEIT